MQLQLDSETLCDCAGADRKPGMKLKSTESNRSLATRRKEAGLKRGEGKTREPRKSKEQREGGRSELPKRLIFCTEGGPDMIGSGGSLE